jgi:hypothetical protein
MNVAEITGAVQDIAGGAIIRAAVTAVNAETHAKFNSATDDSGHFQVAELPPGDYSLSVMADGFQQALQQHIILHAGSRVRQNFTLIVGQHTEIVVVESDPGLVQAESAEVKDVIDNQQVVDLPVRDREFLELAMLGPGVVNPPGGTRGDSLQQTGKLINILGQRTGHNLFLVDGVSVTDQYYNNVALSPSPDDTREFNIAKTNYAAEFGSKSGGVINVVTVGNRPFSRKRLRVSAQQRSRRAELLRSRRASAAVS